ncbi:hypothetical protein ACJX0J_018236, partial [Zea mays]
ATGYSRSLLHTKTFTTLELRLIRNLIDVISVELVLMQNVQKPKEKITLYFFNITPLTSLYASVNT